MVGDATGGNEADGNACKAGSPVWMPGVWHRSPGVAPWWRTAPQTPPLLCQASGSVGCRRTRCWGPKKCCFRWRSAAECCGSLAGLFPRGWRRWPRQSGSPAPAGRGTQAAACSPGEGTRTGRSRLARSLRWGSKSARLARRPAPHLEVLWYEKKGFNVRHGSYSVSVRSKSSSSTIIHGLILQIQTVFVTKTPSWWRQKYLLHVIRYRYFCLSQLQSLANIWTRYWTGLDSFSSTCDDIKVDLFVIYRAEVCSSWQGPCAGFSLTHSLQPPTVTLQPYLESAQLTHIIPSDVHQHSSSTFRSQQAADTMFSLDFLLCISKLATNEAIC